MTKHHVIISGTGRAGTTFLVQLLTELGLHTGFPDPVSSVFANCNAGMEWDIRRPDAPYIVKNPRLCDSLDALVRDGGIVIDRAIIPVRNLYAAAESRRDVTRRAGHTLSGGEIPGGLWQTDDPVQQEHSLAVQFHELLHTIAKHDIPVTLLYFPRFVHDPLYLFEKLACVLSGTTYERFLEGFGRVVRPELVHDFRVDGSASEGTE